ncbi:hypothetical protein ACOI1H_13585 [Loktanella sp. DJP18]|uniref:hypothetical protein n=1 Tax=Loktanella sp. DJP18 TaxID=3409788 RepID=UPI003BB6BA26
MNILAGRSRFAWPKYAGFNCENGLTVSDLSGGFMWMWTYPGDLIASIDPVQRFFELPPFFIGLQSSVILGFVLWPVILKIALEVASRAIQQQTAESVVPQAGLGLIKKEFPAISQNLVTASKSRKEFTGTRTKGSACSPRIEPPLFSPRKALDAEDAD